jgi:hypothetical protein
MSYKTFKRSCNNFTEMARARKITEETGIPTEEEARRKCHDYNDNRTTAQIRKGTKMEYTRE